jgi:hypothetical protein
MAETVKHAHTAVPGEIVASADWNADHSITGQPTAKHVSTLAARSGGAIMGNLTMNVNTVMIAALFVVPARITVNKLQMRAGATPSVPGTIKIGIYSDDGQTKHIEVTTPTIGVQYTGYTADVASVVLEPGVYYVCAVSVGTANVSVRAISQESGATALAIPPPAGKSVVEGQLAVTASTLPATFDPSTLTPTGPRTLSICMFE